MSPANPDRRPLILVVEDEASQRHVLVEYLTRQNFDVVGVDCARAMRKALEAAPCQLVLLDVGLPDEDGFSVARSLRERHPALGIIMVTAASDTVDRVVGLETGADDYLAKPFEPRELLARVRSLLRRCSAASAQAVPATARTEELVPMGRCRLDMKRQVLIDPDGTEQALTASEFDLLSVFAKHPNRPLTREWLLEVTSHRDFEPFDRSIDLRVTRLRRKIEVDPAFPRVIRTVRGVGYLFAREDHGE